MNKRKENALENIEKYKTASTRSNDAIVKRVTIFSSSLRREVFLSVVEALHCSGWLLASRGAHFPVSEEDHGTGLALRLALSG